MKYEWKSYSKKLISILFIIPLLILILLAAITNIHIETTVNILSILILIIPIAIVIYVARILIRDLPKSTRLAYKDGDFYIITEFNSKKTKKIDKKSINSVMINGGSIYIATTKSELKNILNERYNATHKQTAKIKYLIRERGPDLNKLRKLMSKHYNLKQEDKWTEVYTPKHT